MRILVDASAVTRKKAGVGVYAKNLIQELVNQLDGDRLFILAQSDDSDFDFSWNPNVTMIWVPSQLFRKLPLRFLLEQLGIPWFTVRHRIQVVHSLHYSMPLLPIRSRRVVTFHDMTFFDMPEMHVRFKVFYFRFFMRMSVRIADAIIFVSHSAKSDCLAHFRALHGIDAVIHHGCAEVFFGPVSRERIDAVRSRYKLPSRFVLYVGTIEPRKNLNRLVQAFASIATVDSEIQLVVAGAKGWMCDQLMEDIVALGLSARVNFLGFIPESDKASIISAAMVFAYPSLYEGFGLPVLEALACGTPTVTSRVSAIPEIVGNAALLIDPANTQELADALHRLLFDADLREQLRVASRKQAAQFTWETAARKTYRLYQEALTIRAGNKVEPNAPNQSMPTLEDSP
jgi:glycosyltransferase involved in cell wall biosynthesis